MTAAPAFAPVTFEVAGLACRLECAYAKPMLWVTELHPAFRSERAADVHVSFDYDDGYWTRGLPWVATDRLIDAPVHEPDARGGAQLRSAYYDAEIDRSGRQVKTRIAGGFGVGGMLRALYATLLPARGACLVRATVRLVDAGAILVCDDPDDGVVALVSDGAHVAVEPTPFHGGTTTLRASRRRVIAIDAGDDGISKATAAARVLANVVVVDHSPRTLERVLDVVMRLPNIGPIPGRLTRERVASAGR